MEKFNEWIREYQTTSTRKIHQTRIKRFCEISNISLADLTELSAKQCRTLLIETRDKMKQEGKSSNTILGYISSVRSYFDFLDKPIKIKRSALPKSEMASGYHVFSNGDLSSMFEHADIRMKSLLSVAVSTGHEINSIENMDRKYFKSLIEKAIAEKEEFLFIMDRRPKTNESRLTVLNPLAIRWLSIWFKASEKTHNTTVFGIKGDQIRNELEKLARASGIKLTGKIRPHNLRKWVMSSLDKAGFTEFQTKFIMGKSIGKSDMTYLVSLKNVIEEKYPSLYDQYLSITKTSKEIKTKDEQIEKLENALIESEKKIATQDTRLEVMQKQLLKLTPKDDRDAYQNAMKQAIEDMNK